MGMCSNEVKYEVMEWVERIILRWMKNEEFVERNLSE